MVLRIAIVAGLIAVSLALVQRQHVLQHAGLTGYCTQIATPAGEDGVWQECLPGKLTGTPGLSRGSCVRISHATPRDVWRCPTPLQANTARQ